MQSVGAALDGGVDHAARRVAELGVVVAGLHFEFGQRIGRRLDHEARAVQEVHGVRVVVYAIQYKIVLLRALSVGVEVALPLAARSIGLGYAGRQLRDEDVVTAIQRSVVDHLRADHLSGRRLLRLQELRRAGVYRHRLRYVAGLQLYIGREALVHIQDQAGQGSGGKSRGGRGHRVVADLHRGEDVYPILVGRALQHQAGIVLCKRDFSIGHHRAGGIGHCAGDGALIDLRQHSQGQRDP